MDWIEVSDRTLEGAIERALDSLGVHESELEYEVVVEPKAGFLGLGRTQARIRARVRPISREKPQDRRRRKRNETRKGRSTGGRSGSGEGRGDGRGPRDQPKGSGPAREPSEARSGAGARSSEGGSGDGEAAEPSEGGRSRSRNRRRKPAGERTDAATSGRGPEPTRSRERADNEGASDMAETTISVDEQMAEAKGFAEGFLDAFGIEATVTSRLEDDDIEIDIEGENLGVLVGPKGATLSAIEELVRTAVLVRAGGFGARIHVDVSGYRRRRRAALAEFATKLADDVRASGVAKVLEPMSAADRKVVHDTVTDLDGVATTSEGEEPRRRVVIRPA